MTQKLAPEKGLSHKLFEAGIAAKAVFAAFEVFAGATLLALPNDMLMRTAHWLIGNDLVESPHGTAARKFAQMATHFSASSQHFYAIYLLGHGLLKLIVVYLLQRRIALAYPIAIAVFAGFVVYQLHEWALRGSPVMLALSALDLAVIFLTWREWHDAARVTSTR